MRSQIKQMEEIIADWLLNHEPEMYHGWWQKRLAEHLEGRIWSTWDWGDELTTIIWLIFPEPDSIPDFVLR